MTAAPDMWDELNAVCVDTFRERVPAVFVVDGVAVIPVDVAFHSAWQGDSISGMGFERPVPMMELRQSTLPAGVVEGSAVYIRNQRMRITEISHDSAGLARVLLAEVRE